MTIHTSGYRDGAGPSSLSSSRQIPMVLSWPANWPSTAVHIPMDLYPHSCCQHPKSSHMFWSWRQSSVLNSSLHPRLLPRCFASSPFPKIGRRYSLGLQISKIDFFCCYYWRILLLMILLMLFFWDKAFYFYCQTIILWKLFLHLFMEGAQVHGSWFSPTNGVQRIELKLGLVASNFTCWAIGPAPSFYILFFPPNRILCS